MKNIIDIVQDQILEDKELTNKISKRLLEGGVNLTDQDIEEFFPELNTSKRKNRSNIPKGVPFIYQLLIDPPTVFDLGPLEELQFEI